MPQSGDSNFKNYSFIPPPDESIADLLSNQMGGKNERN
jgi:hypothetical protein